MAQLSLAVLFVIAALAESSVIDDSFCEGREDGNYADPDNCARFYQCVGHITYSTTCPAGLLYYPPSDSCEFPTGNGCEVVTPVPIEDHTDATQTAISPPTPNDPNFCAHREDGNYADPESCVVFYQCVGGITYVQMCPAHLHYNPTDDLCDFPENAGCV